MGGGNGAKAQQKRERNAKNASKTNTSNLGTTDERIRCPCFRLWMTTQKTEAEAHYNDKHAKAGTYDAVMEIINLKK